MLSLHRRLTGIKSYFHFNSGNSRYFFQKHGIHCFKEGVRLARCANTRMISGTTAVSSCCIVFQEADDLCKSSFVWFQPCSQYSIHQMVRPAPCTVIHALTEGQHCAIWSYALTSAHICTVFLMHNYFASPYVHLLVRLLLCCLPNWLSESTNTEEAGSALVPTPAFIPV